jgi:uncharacterized protein YukE
VTEPFDHSAADGAAVACERAAAALAEARRQQVVAGAGAADGWLGPHRHRFDRDLARALRHAEALEVALRGLADELRARSAAARERARA